MDPSPLSTPKRKFNQLSNDPSSDSPASNNNTPASNNNTPASNNNNTNILSSSSSSSSAGSSSSNSTRSKPPLSTSSSKPPLLSTAIFTFEPTLAMAISLEDGGSSPRSRVAHKLAGLVLADDGGAGLSRVSLPAPMQHHQKEHSDGDLVRKRVRLLASERSSPSPSPCPSPPSSPSPKSKIRPPTPPRAMADWAKGLHVAAATAVAAVVDPAVAVVRPARTAIRLQRSNPSLRSRPESKSRRKRAGTPPLAGSAAAARDADGGDGVVDPVRAALTWHEDEITIYDPDDEDDDGTGINGIGFKPTPAIAYARRLKQKQQLAEYKKREAIDARARRNQKRKGKDASPPTKPQKEPASVRRVRFMEAEPTTFFMTWDQ